MLPRDPLVQCQEVTRIARSSKGCNGFLDRCTGETAVSTKRGFESSTSWCSAGDIQCRILHLKPRGLPVLTTTGIESPKNLLNSLVCNAYEIRPGKGDRRFSKKRDGFGWIWKKWKMKQRPKSFVLWSGRWESNPRPKLGKLLYCHCTTPALKIKLANWRGRGNG